MASFSVDAMVRGYHVYRDISTVIGHVPRKVSSICSLFLRKEGSITCQVAGCKRYSEDLPQGVLEVPCLLRFEGDTKVFFFFFSLYEFTTIEVANEGLE